MHLVFQDFLLKTTKGVQLMKADMPLGIEIYGHYQIAVEVILTNKGTNKNGKLIAE